MAPDRKNPANPEGPARSEKHNTFEKTVRRRYSGRITPAATPAWPDDGPCLSLRARSLLTSSNRSRSARASFGLGNRSRLVWGATNIETKVIGKPSQKAANRLPPRSLSLT